LAYAPLHKIGRWCEPKLPNILDLDSRWKWVLSCTLRPLESRENSSGQAYPLDRKLDAPQWLWMWWQKRKFLSAAWNRTLSFNLQPIT